MSPPKPPPGFKLVEPDAPPAPPPGFKLVVEQPAAPQASMSESALQGVAQGASFGFADELAGLVTEGASTLSKGLVGSLKSAPGRAALRAYLGGKADHLPDAALDVMIDAGAEEGAQTTFGTSLDNAGYTTGRNEARRDVRKAEAANPKTFFASNIAGSMLVPVPGGAASKFDTVIGRSLKNAKAFGGMGALSGLGNSEADLMKGEFGQALEDTAIGGGIGGGIGLATGPAAYAWARHARPALEKVANSRALSAIAPTAGLANRLRKAVGGSDAELQQAGEKVLDSGILKPFGTAAGAQGRNQAILDETGATIGGALDQADDLVSQGVARAPSRQLQRLAVNRALTDAADTPATQALRPAIGKTLLESTGRDVGPPASFRELWKNKSQLQDALKPDEFSNLGQKLYRKGVAGYTKGVYGQLEGAIGPDAMEPFRDATRRYGDAATIQDLLDETVSRQASHQTIGLGDAMRGSALGEMVPGGSAVATLLGAATRGRIDSTMATGARAMSRMRPNVPNYLMKGAAEGARSEVDEEDEASVQAFLRGP